MSNNDKNGAESTERSQALSDQKIDSLIQAFAGLDTEALQKLPSNVAEAIELLKVEAARSEQLAKQLAEERKALEAEREAVANDRAAASSDRKEAVESLKAALAERQATAADNAAFKDQALKDVMGAAAESHAREAKQDQLLHSWSNSLTSIDSRLDVLEVIKSGFNDFKTVSEARHSESMRLTMEIQGSISSLHGKHDMLAIEVNNGFAKIGNGVDTLQNSVDKIGIMLNRMMDFITHIRDVVVETQEATLRVEDGLSKVKAGTFEVVKAFHGKVMQEFQNYSQVPKQIAAHLTTMNSTVMTLKHESKKLVDRGNQFGEDMEARLDGVMDVIGNLKNLYASHVARLDKGLDTQMEIFKVKLQEDAEEVSAILTDAYRKSEIFDMLGKVHKYIEQVDHSHKGASDLLRAIQAEEINLKGEIKQAATALTENLSMNAKEINQAVSGIARDVRSTRDDASDATAAVKELIEAISRTRIKLVELAAHTESLMDLGHDGAMTIAKAFLEENTQQLQHFADILSTQIGNEFTSLKTEGVLGMLGGSMDDDQNNNKN